MRKTKNSCHVEGFIHSLNKLELKETGSSSKNPGTPYITGTLNIATDDELTNIIPIHYTYVTEVTSTGKTDSRFGILKDIIEGKLGNIIDNGVDGAAKLRIDTSIGLNDFYSDKNGQEELVTSQRYEGGFIHTTQLLAPEKDRNTIDVDMLIERVYEVEGDVERQIPDKVLLEGYIFDDYRKTVMPVKFKVVDNPEAINYFLNLGASKSNPIFTHLKGLQISTTVIRRYEEPSAFGPASIREVPSSRRDMVINWAAGESYILGEDGDLSGAELEQMLVNRENYLKDIKARSDAYKNSKNNPSVPVFTSETKPKYNF